MCLHFTQFNCVIFGYQIYVSLLISLSRTFVRMFISMSFIFHFHFRTNCYYEKWTFQLFSIWPRVGIPVAFWHSFFKRIVCMRALFRFFFFFKFWFLCECAQFHVLFKVAHASAEPSIAKKKIHRLQCRRIFVYFHPRSEKNKAMNGWGWNECEFSCVRRAQSEWPTNRIKNR